MFVLKSIYERKTKIILVEVKQTFFSLKKLLHHMQNKLANEILRFLNAYDLITAVILAY